MVMFIYRPEYYDLTTDENGNSTAGRAEIIIAKHRNGSLQNVPLKFIARLAKFVDLENLPDNYDTHSALEPSKDFGNPSNTVIRGSRMNDIEEDAPF